MFPDQFRGGDISLFLSQVVDPFADKTEGDGHEPSSKSHDGIESVSRSIPRSGKPEDGEGGEIGGRHCEEKKERPQVSPAEKKIFRGAFGISAAIKPDEKNDQKIKTIAADFPTIFPSQ